MRKEIFLVVLSFLFVFCLNNIALASDYYLTVRPGISFSKKETWEENKLFGGDIKVKLDSGKSFSASIGRKFEAKKFRFKVELEGSYGKTDVEKVESIELWTIQNRLPVKIEKGPFDADGTFKEYFGTLSFYWESKNWTPVFDMYMGFGIGFDKAYLNDFEIKGVTSKARDFDGSVKIIHLDVGLMKATKHIHIGVGYRYNYTGTISLDSFDAKFPRHMVNAFLTIVF